MTARESRRVAAIVVGALAVHGAVLFGIRIAFSPPARDRFVDRPPKMSVELIERVVSPADRAEKSASEAKRPPRRQEEAASPPLVADAREAIFLPRRPPGSRRALTLREMSREAARAEAAERGRSILNDPAFAAYFGGTGRPITDFWCDERYRGGRQAPSAPAGPMVTMAVDFNRALYRLSGKVMAVDVGNPISYERLVAMLQSGEITSYAFRDYFLQLHAQLVSHPLARRTVLVPMAGYEGRIEDEPALARLRAAKSVLVALLLDVELRRATHNRVTLAGVDRALAADPAALLSDAGTGSAFRLAHLAAVTRETETDFAPFFRKFVFGAEPVPAPSPSLDALREFGVRGT